MGWLSGGWEEVPMWKTIKEALIICAVLVLCYFALRYCAQMNVEGGPGI